MVSWLIQELQCISKKLRLRSRKLRLDLVAMLFSINELVKHWRISPKSVLHIGAHLAEECDLYRSVGWNKVIWIEANPELINDLRKKIIRLFGDTACQMYGLIQKNGPGVLGM